MMGLRVVSISRSGRPGWLTAGWKNSVEWQNGNAHNPSTYTETLKGAMAAVSCIGGFGSNDAMYQICGQANITAIETAAAVGVSRFVFISVHDYGFPDFFLNGYFKGKKDAERTLKECFGDNGVSLRPGFIYGTRYIGSFGLPLGVIGAPLEKGLSLLPNLKQFAEIPYIGALIFLPPVSVEAVGKAAATAAMDSSVPGGPMGVWDIAKYK